MGLIASGLQVASKSHDSADEAFLSIFSLNIRGVKMGSTPGVWYPRVPPIYLQTFVSLDVCAIHLPPVSPSPSPSTAVLPVPLFVTMTVSPARVLGPSPTPRRSL